GAPSRALKSDVWYCHSAKSSSYALHWSLRTRFARLRTRFARLAMTTPPVIPRTMPYCPRNLLSKGLNEKQVPHCIRDDEGRTGSGSNLAGFFLMHFQNRRDRANGALVRVDRDRTRL